MHFISNLCRRSTSILCVCNIACMVWEHTHKVLWAHVSFTTHIDGLYGLAKLDAVAMWPQRCIGSLQVQSILSHFGPSMSLGFAARLGMASREPLLPAFTADETPHRSPCAFRQGDRDKLTPCALRQVVVASSPSPPGSSATPSPSSSSSPPGSMEPPRKRLRHSVKTSDPSVPQPVPSEELEAPQKEMWAGVYTENSRKMYFAVRYRLKLWAQEQMRTSQVATGGRPHLASQLFYARLAGSWKKGDPLVNRTIVAGLERSGAPERIIEWAQRTYPEDEFEHGADGRRRWLAAHQCLMTWNGEWGKIDGKGLDCYEGNWRGLVAHLAILPAVKELWEEFVAFVDNVTCVHNLKDWAASMEVCMATWEEKSQVRIHLHLCWKSTNRLQLRSPCSFIFRGAVPHKAATIATLQTRVSGSWCGLYYLLCPKIGKIFSRGSKAAFTQFPVSSEWVFSMLQSEKMELDDARCEVIKCGKGLVRKLADLEKLAQVRAQQATDRRIAVVQAEIAKTSKEFKGYEAIEKWKASALLPFQRRKKFLVMEGPSGVGKTEYVRGLFGYDALLELNAANCGTSPDLRGFERSKHKVILFAEASVDMVLQNRKLFQAPACYIDLGHSPTGRDVYKVFLNDACLVVASNRWTEQLEGVKGLVRKLADLDKLAQALTRLVVGCRVAAVQDEIAKSNKEFKGFEVIGTGGRLAWCFRIGKLECVQGLPG